MNFGGNTVQLKIPTHVHYTIKDSLTSLVYLCVYEYTIQAISGEDK